MRQIANFANYMNHYFIEFLNSSLVIEPVFDGIVYIFKDLESFELIHTPVLPAMIQRLDEELKIPQNPKLSLLPAINDIPTVNLCLWFEFTNISIDDGVCHMRKYYSAIDPDILITQRNDFLFIQFPTARSALHYLGVLLLQYPNEESAR